MDLDDERHEAPMRRAIELAREAGERGDGPYGSVLVRDGDMVMEARNRTVTDDDIAEHPELALARRAASELSPAERTATTMYTSTEPCPMCATGMVYAGLGAVVYSVSGARAAEVTGGTAGIPCQEVVDRYDADMAVAGPLLEDEGLAVHRAFRG